MLDFYEFLQKVKLAMFLQLRNTIFWTYYYDYSHCNFKCVFNLMVMVQKWLGKYLKSHQMKTKHHQDNKHTVITQKEQTEQFKISQEKWEKGYGKALLFIVWSDI